MDNEIWKPVVGFEACYEVSNHARVRTIERTVFRKGRNESIVPQKVNSKIKKWYEGWAKGYPCVTLSLKTKGERRKSIPKLVHVMVAEAWIDKPVTNEDVLLEVNHIDGNKWNPLPENLEWVTHADNVLHGYETGLSPGSSKITKDDIARIKKLRDDGLLMREVAEQLKIPVHVIKDMLAGRRFKRLLARMGYKVEKSDIHNQIESNRIVEIK